MSPETLISSDIETRNNLGKCQAEVHAPEFYDANGNVIPHDADSRDHLTSRKIAHRLRWKSLDFRDPNAIIPMHTKCHRIKDSSTQARISFVKEIVHGTQLVTLDNYREFRNKHDVIISENGNGNRHGVIFESKSSD